MRYRKMVEDKKMIYIRADANASIGMGHIMRCLSIADALRAYDCDISFILADEAAQSLVEARGYQARVLYSDYQKMDDELGLWPQGLIDLIIVDSYYVTSTYLKELKKRVEEGALIYIDDFASYPYPVDVLVNYNAYGFKFDYHKLYQNSNVKEPKLLLGPEYAPLRGMFRGVKKKIQPKKVQNILISTGGSDSEHIALSIIKAKPSDFTHHILLGALNLDKTEMNHFE